jgi:hypothetical protein
MENNRKDIMVIFAGYPIEMDQFLDSNPGIRSRVSNHFKFSDYSPKELFEIMDQYEMRKKGYLLHNNIKPKIMEILTNTPNLNGREVRNFVDIMIIEQGNRLGLLPIEERNKLTVQDLTMLTEVDLENAIKKYSVNRAKVPKKDKQKNISLEDLIHLFAMANHAAKK